MGKPHYFWLALLAILALAPLWLGIVGSPIGSFAMFTNVVRYRLNVSVQRADGSMSSLGPNRLGPHLGHDARRVILPAFRGFLGETQVSLLAAGLDDIGNLACRLEADASRVELLLERSRLDGSRLPDLKSMVPCDAR